MTILTRKYHADIGIPDDVEGPVVGTRLTYTVHAYRAAAIRRVQYCLPVALPHFTLVEVETLGGKPVKWVVRCSLDFTKDLVFVLTSEYLVKTVWVNDALDSHATLDRSKYDRP